MRSGAFDSLLSKLYGADESVLSAQRARYCETLTAFAKLFGSDRDASIYSIPGRTELCGNHTDHNGGVVMASAVDVDMIAVVSKARGGRVRVFSEDFRGGPGVSLADLSVDKTEVGKSSAMIRGVAAGLRRLHGKVAGFDAYTASNILKGSGLSSSAAFEICVGAIFNGEYNDGRFTPVDLAKVGQYAENAYFGKPSGLMDQVACAVGGVLTIDFQNPLSPVVTKIPFDLASCGFKLVVTDTKGSHSSLTDEYAAIRSEMEHVARVFGKANLRAVKREDFFASIADVRAKTGDRATLRALHFFEECRRVVELAAAAERGDIKRFLEIILESGHSSFEYNQNAYCARETRRQGIPLALALSQSVLAGRGAWRLQGGGFAGTIQAFVPNELLEEYCSTLSGVFGKGACKALTFRGEGPVRINGRGGF